MNKQALKFASKWMMGGRVLLCFALHANAARAQSSAYLLEVTISYPDPDCKYTIFGQYVYGQAAILQTECNDLALAQWDESSATASSICPNVDPATSVEFSDAEWLPGFGFATGGNYEFVPWGNFGLVSFPGGTMPTTQTTPAARSWWAAPAAPFPI